GVDVRLGVDATAPTISALDPDVVIIATGSRTPDDQIDLEQAVRATGQRDAATRVTIVGGDLIGLSVAGFLADRGLAVTGLEPGQQLGLAMAMPRRWSTVADLTTKGVELVRNAVVPEDEELARTADVVLRTTNRAPGSTLANDLRAIGIEAHV